MSNLSDIGFPTPNDQAVNDMIMRVLEFAEPVHCPRGFYLRFSDASGAEIYLQGNLNQELIGFNPHFKGKSRRKVGLTRAIERDFSELDGGFYAWANPADSDVENSGEYPFVFDVPDFRAVAVNDFPSIVEIQLTAFASNDFKIFANEKDFDAWQSQDIKLASKSFILSGLFAPDGKANEAELPQPIGLLAGEILEVELKSNQLTNEKFYWFWTDTLGGEIDVVADPRYVLQKPRIGGILHGTFWLSGRLLK